MSRLAFDSLAVLLVLAFLLYPAVAPYSDEAIKALNRYFYGAVNNRKDLAVAEDMLTADDSMGGERFNLVDRFLVGGPDMLSVLVKRLNFDKAELKREAPQIAQLLAFHVLCKAFDSGNYQLVKEAKPYLKDVFRGKLQDWLNDVFEQVFNAPENQNRLNKLETLRRDFARIKRKRNLTDNLLVAKAIEFWPKLKVDPLIQQREWGRSPPSQRLSPPYPPPYPRTPRRNRGSPLPALDLLSEPLPDDPGQKLMAPLIPLPPSTALFPPRMDTKGTGDGQRLSGAPLNA